MKKLLSRLTLWRQRSTAWSGVGASRRFRNLAYARVSIPRQATLVSAEPSSIGTASGRSARRWSDQDATATRQKPSRMVTQTVQVVLPVYNEQACIGHTLESIATYLETHPNYTFVFVNDGSSDRTAEIIANYIADHSQSQMLLLSYPDRGGKGCAVKTGVNYADGDLICFLDSDLAYSLDHLDRLVEQLQYYDVAIGCRSLVTTNPQGIKFQRKLAGKIYNWLSRKLLNLDFRDMQAGLKGFRIEVAKRLFAQQRLMGFSFDVELMYLAQKQGFSIGEIPARVSKSHQQKASKVNLIEDSLKMLGDLIQIRWNDLLGRYR